MTHRIDRTLPHHPALALVIHTQPRRDRTLDDRTPAQIRSQITPSPPPHHRHG